MSTTQTRSDPRQHQVETPAATPPEIAPLDRTLETIKLDSRSRPESYLDETEVPDGGE